MGRESSARAQPADTPGQSAGGVSSPPSDLEGQRIGRYVVAAALGSGAAGSVYVAIDPQLERKVALKCVEISSLSQIDDALAEARALAALDHPAIVSIFDVGVEETLGIAYLAMELVWGAVLT